MLNRKILDHMARLFGGEIVIPRGRSAAIDAFLDTLALEPYNAGRRDALAAWRERAAYVDIDPDVEERRVASVLGWSTHVYLALWAHEAGVAWAPEHAIPDADEAAEDAEALALQTLAVRAEIDPAPWDPAFAALERRTQVAQLRVRVPEAWEPLRVPLYRAAWNCARLVAGAAEAHTLDDALASLEPLYAWLRSVSERQVETMILMR